MSSWAHMALLSLYENNANLTVAQNHELAMEEAHFGLDPMHTFMMWNLKDGLFSDHFKPFIIPLVGLLVGTIMMQVPKVATVGKLVLYFGSQSFMNIYMGWVMRTSVTVPMGTIFNGSSIVATPINESYVKMLSGEVVLSSSLGNVTKLEVDLTGCPAGFALTAMQQVISFVAFIIFFIGVYWTPYKYTPKKLDTTFEIACVVIFGCVFALNIALNNFSLGYISIAVNLIIRSCLPLSTYLSSQALAVFKLYPFKPCKPKEIALMVVGVICAGVFTMANILSSKASGKADKDSSSMIMGVIMCIASLLCGSLNLALAGVLGETKLNVYDTVAYMAIPATLFLLPIAMFLEKPVPGEWSVVFAKSRMTDYEILAGVWGLNKRTICWLVLSGVFSFMYNIVQFSIVHTLSPSATAFGGNFNKAALIFLTLLLPFLRVHELPGYPYIQVIWCAVIVNIVAFSYYSFLQIQAKQQEAARLIEDQSDDQSDDESDEEEESSEDGNGKY
mmetsp:Transcript_56130/g.142250  ORF Transcript_56130/g.142250 Transcript_56130/m.142250 type:complete len:503 (+) Transcript_56130:97-1605(+)|eukprot:CAMPEP_0183438364 /NCGR_PEP_ID=MMETSP0370-20130417/77340_1 /TAXON_ID=268820 /ORGANISM="Peridinium aciculiferum, Strain PAER-2" /LENGTH=502 /DNA_ID=CAMNT_0025626577 /DNA_START=47 /DNA_END=1555 /DNA_ORIENTATION=+